MKLKLTLARPGSSQADDLLVTVDTTVSVGALAQRIRRCDPAPATQLAAPETLTLRIDGEGSRVLSPAEAVADAGLRSGQTVSLVDAGKGFDGGRPTEAVAELVVLEGPDAGKQFPLRAGSNQIGRERGNDVLLTDPVVSKNHARINIGEVVEIIDLGSSNGTLIGGEPVPRAILRAQDTAQLGDTVVRVVHAARAVPSAVGVEFNRSPRLDVVYPGVTIPAPGVPQRLRPQRLPIIPLLAPVLMGMVMFALTRQLVTVLFVALSPVMMIGNVIEGRVFGRRDLRAAIEMFRTGLDQLRVDLTRAAGEEAVARRAEHRATSDLVAAATRREPLLWSLQPDQRGFLELRCGLGVRPSRNAVEMSRNSDNIPELWAELVQVQSEFSSVGGVPVVVSLVECGSVGVAGPRGRALDVARALVAQLCCLHSPAEVIVAAVASSATVSDWDWLKWLPHTGSDHTPLAGEHLAATPASALRLVSELEDLIEARRSEHRHDDPLQLPAVVVIVEDEAPVERSRLVEVAEAGRGIGVHLMWMAPSVPGLPAACRTFVEIDPTRPGVVAVGYVDGGERVDDVTAEQLDAAAALALARSLSPVVDNGARVDDESDLPRSIPLVSLLDADLVRSPDAVIDRWRTTGSLPDDDRDRPTRRESHLRASVGQAAGQGLVLDLREHGPHALVGGTTGAGKSEFLQSWIMGMALDHSPVRVNFLLVDYKGGSAFRECVELPHAVGLVTDLSPHLVRRVLTSLHAELKRREHILQAGKAKDLLELERRGDPNTPPSLIIVVDEFAALVQEVPEFIDGVVNVAQRGRSLGLHLILATQRPAGVIKDNLRANTNLRVALRMADEADSEDVVGMRMAATFDPAVPGRAVAKVGPGRVIPFQSGYVGGWTSDTPPPPVITIDELTFGVGVRWDSPGETVEPAPTGPNDLQRMVANVRAANDRLALPVPRRPWLDTLAPLYDLARSPQSRTDSELIFGIVDDPENQRQNPVAFHPDRDGNMAVYGTGGAGKSAFLRILAVVAGLGFRGGPCHVYGLDFGARGLQMLEPLPHVGAIIHGEDHERIQRLLRRLRHMIDERAARYAAANVGSITEYRAAAAQPDEARVLLLLDGVSAFRQAYEVGSNSRWFDTFQSIAADGRQVGVHVVLSADRASAVPAALGSVIQRRLVLRLASENDYVSLGVPSDVLGSESPPGRGILDNSEVQVAVLGRSAGTFRQATAIEKLAGELAPTARTPAPPIERLAERVRLGDLPAAVEGMPVLGVADESLGPMSFTPDDVLLIVGPALSGRTSTLATIALSLERWKPGRVVYLGGRRSPLLGLIDWYKTATNPDEVSEVAREVITQLPKGEVTAVFVEDVSSFISTAAETPLLDLVKACRTNGVLFVTDAESSTMGSWPLQNAVKASRHGIALQPDQTDGDAIFKTSFPRLTRAEFPPGRGFYVRGGFAHRVQVALPEVDHM